MPQMPRSLPNGEACLSRRTLPPLKQPNSSIRPTRADGGEAAGSRRFRLKRRVGRDFSFCFRMVAGIGLLRSSYQSARRYALGVVPTNFLNAAANDDGVW